MKRLMLAMSAAALFAGCASIERTSPGMMDGLDVVGGNSPAEETVCARSFGLGLLYLITFISGDVEYDDVKHDVSGGVLFFRDRCNCADCFRTVQAIAKDRGKVATNVNMYNNSLPNQGITGYTDFLGWFLETEDVGCSAVLRAR